MLTGDCDDSSFVINLFSESLLNYVRFRLILNLIRIMFTEKSRPRMQCVLEEKLLFQLGDATLETACRLLLLSQIDVATCLLTR